MKVKKKNSETIWNCSCKCIRKSANPLPTSGLMPTSTKFGIWAEQWIGLGNGIVDFRTEDESQQRECRLQKCCCCIGNRGKSMNQLPTLVFFWVLFKVGKSAADFTLKSVQVCGEADKPDVDFSIRDTVHSRRWQCRLQVFFLKLG